MRGGKLRAFVDVSFTHPHGFRFSFWLTFRTNRSFPHFSRHYYPYVCLKYTTTIYILPVCPKATAARCAVLERIHEAAAQKTQTKNGKALPDICGQSFPYEIFMMTMCRSGCRSVASKEEDGRRTVFSACIGPLIPYAAYAAGQRKDPDIAYLFSTISGYNMLDVFSSKKGKAWVKEP